MLKIDSSNLDNFDLNTEISDTNSTKDFEYDVEVMQCIVLDNSPLSLFFVLVTFTEIMLFPLEL